MKRIDKCTLGKCTLQIQLNLEVSIYIYLYLMGNNLLCEQASKSHLKLLFWLLGCWNCLNSTPQSAMKVRVSGLLYCKKTQDLKIEILAGSNFDLIKAWIFLQMNVQWELCKGQCRNENGCPQFSISIYIIHNEHQESKHDDALCHNLIYFGCTLESLRFHFFSAKIS